MDLAQLELDVQELAAQPAARAPAKKQPTGGILKKPDSPKEVRGAGLTVPQVLVQATQIWRATDPVIWGPLNHSISRLIQSF